VTELTRRQQECLGFIEDYLARHRYAPSYDEIRVGLGLRATSSAHQLVGRIAARGRIARVPNRMRAIAPFEGGAPSAENLATTLRARRAVYVARNFFRRRRLHRFQIKGLEGDIGDIWAT
jgi:SOS-response transcriptional repressor LexA